MALALVLIAWFAVTNIAAYRAFALDKARSVSGGWRIAERDLLLLCAIGGIVGGYAGRYRFRHKTRKQPFSFLMHLTAAVQAGLVIGLLA